MIAIVVFLLLTLLLAAGVVLYVAFPHRGMPVPYVPWVAAVLVAPVVFVRHLLPGVEPFDTAED